MSLNVLGPLFFVGIDWAAATHAVCVLDNTGRRVAAFTVEHTAAGLAALRPAGPPRWTGDAGRDRTPDGRLVDVLLEAGHPVVPVSPNAIKTWRDGEVVSGAKSDAGDAHVIADICGCATRLHLAAPYTAAPWRCAPWSAPRATWSTAGRRHQPALRPAGRALARRQGDLRRRRVPDRAGVPDPLPDRRHAEHLGAKRLAAFCANTATPAGAPASNCWPGCAPAGTTDEIVCEAVRDAVTALVTALRPSGSVERPGPHRHRHLGEHPDGEIFTSLPRSGQINAAQMLAEWGDAAKPTTAPTRSPRSPASPR